MTVREVGQLAGHRVFNADRFLDKFVGRESLIRQYVGSWNGRANIADVATLDVPRFKQYLVGGNGSGKDELLEGLYRAYDLCTERGHEDLLAACRDFDYDPDPNGELPVECLSLKVRTENEEAFNLAYDRNALWQAERFSIYQGPGPRETEDLPATAAICSTACPQEQALVSGLCANYQEGEQRAHRSVILCQPLLSSKSV